MSKLQDHHDDFITMSDRREDVQQWAGIPLQRDLPDEAVMILWECKEQLDAIERIARDNDTDTITISLQDLFNIFNSFARLSWSANMDWQNTVDAIRAEVGERIARINPDYYEDAS